MLLAIHARTRKAPQPTSGITQKITIKMGKAPFCRQFPTVPTGTLLHNVELKTVTPRHTMYSEKVCAPEPPGLRAKPTIPPPGNTSVSCFWELDKNVDSTLAANSVGTFASHKLTVKVVRNDKSPQRPEAVTVAEFSSEAIEHSGAVDCAAQSSAESKNSITLSNVRCRISR